MNYARQMLVELGKYGWCQEEFGYPVIEEIEYRDDSGNLVCAIYGDTKLDGVCLLGAAGIAYQDNYQHYAGDVRFADIPEDEQRTLLTIEAVIEEQFPDRLMDKGLKYYEQNHTVYGPFLTIPDFNDHCDTTLEDVLLVVEKAAIKLEESA